jgi:hypothetical protein
VCYNYGKTGHFIAECSKKKSSKEEPDYPRCEHREYREHKHHHSHKKGGGCSKLHFEWKKNIIGKYKGKQAFITQSEDSTSSSSQYSVTSSSSSDSDSDCGARKGKKKVAEGFTGLCLHAGRRASLCTMAQDATGTTTDCTEC